jgi:hypothetical protein
VDEKKWLSENKRSPFSPRFLSQSGAFRMISITDIFGDDKVAHDLTLFSPEHVKGVEKRLFAKGKQGRPYERGGGHGRS